jgi:imidazole glycerol-phosphate synthase subunit HisH
VTRNIQILDLGLGNVLSVANMFEYIDAEATLISTTAELAADSLLVLPGVGAFDTGVKAIERGGWREALEHRHKAGQLILGICLGMQLLCSSSQEGDLKGLGLIPGHFEHLADRVSQTLVKVPHMGWNRMEFNTDLAPWAPDPERPSRFYFVHSYHYVHDTDEHVAGWAQHGARVVGMISSGRTVGMQFHPEKSHHFGAGILRRLMEHLDA